jgi:hypothetical protein
MGWGFSCFDSKNEVQSANLRSKLVNVAHKKQLRRCRRPKEVPTNASFVWGHPRLTLLFHVVIYAFVEVVLLHPSSDQTPVRFAVKEQ